MNIIMIRIIIFMNSMRNYWIELFCAQIPIAILIQQRVHHLMSDHDDDDNDDDKEDDEEDDEDHDDEDDKDDDNGHMTASKKMS